MLQNEQMRLDDILGTSGDTVAAPKAAAAARLEVLKKEIAYHNKQYYVLNQTTHKHPYPQYHNKKCMIHDSCPKEAMLP